MSGLNRWEGIVNLGSDPELRFTQSGHPVLSFRGACNEKYVTNGQEKEIVTWLGFTIWGKRGESLSKLLSKGDRVLVEGQLRIGEYEDRDGNKRTKVEINVQDIHFMGGRGRGGGAGNQGAAPSRDNGGGAVRGGAPHGGGGRPAPAPAPDGDVGGYPPDGFSNDDDIPF